MSIIKVLPLSHWTQGGHLLTTPKFFRPGLYLHGNECWMELPDGIAVTCSRGAFLFELRMHHAGELNHRQAAALEAIVEARLATREQKKMLTDYQEAQYGRKLYRSGMHKHYKFLLKVAQMKWKNQPNLPKWITPHLRSGDDV